MLTRQTAVAGFFYPEDPTTLSDTVASFLEQARTSRAAFPADSFPKAIIAPHAGYPYSGPIAATVYGLLQGARARIRRVVLLGPAHRVYLRAMAFPSVDAFASPLANVPLDKASIARALELEYAQVSDEAHAEEHCLEVQLPFLQTVLDEFALVPFVVGDCPPSAVAAVLESLWGGEGTLIVVSSDLSHYLPYDQAQDTDRVTSQAIEARSSRLLGDEACGAHAINGLMLVAERYGLEVRTLDVRNSGDTAGDRSSVVGYGAYALS